MGEFFFDYLCRGFFRVINWQFTGNVFVSLLGYIALGAIAGEFSLLLFPKQFIHDPGWQMIYLFIMPAVMGGIMSRFGYYLKRKKMKMIGLDTFSYGYLFALSMSFVRFLLGK